MGFKHLKTSSHINIRAHRYIYWHPVTSYITARAIFSVAEAQHESGVAAAPVNEIHTLHRSAGTIIVFPNSQLRALLCSRSPEHQPLVPQPLQK